MSSFSAAIDRWAWRVLKVDKYEAIGNTLTRHRGVFARQEIPINEIKSWSIWPEIGRDVVTITLLNNRQIVWVDKYDDLVKLLKMLLPEKCSK